MPRLEHGGDVRQAHRTRAPTGRGRASARPTPPRTRRSRATTHSASIIEPGRARREQQGDGPAEPQHAAHAAGQRQLAGARERSRSHDDISARNDCTETSSRPMRSIAPTGSSALLRRAPEGRPAADRRARHLGAAARARGAAPARGDDVAGVGAAAAQRRAHRGAHLAAQRGRAPRCSARRPGGADPGARARGSRRPAGCRRPATTAWSMSRAFSGAVPRPTRARNSSRPISAASGPRAARSGSRRARPSRRLSRRASRPPSSKCTTKRSQPRGAGSSSIAMRPAMPRCRPEHRPVAGGLDPHRLAAAVRGGQLAADERVGDLAGRVRAADVAVAVVDGDDAPEQGATLDRRARTLSLRKLRHPDAVSQSARCGRARQLSARGRRSDALRARRPRRRA